MKTFTKAVLSFVAVGMAAVPFCCGQSISWKAITSLVRTTFPDVPQLSTQDLAAWIHARKTLVLLDARKPEEFAVSHLAKAQRIDPNASTFEDLQSIDKNTPIVVYCSVGYRSAELATRLKRAGFKQVYNLEGSIFKWANEGRPVFRDQQEVREVHPYDDAWGKLLNKPLRAYQPRK